jgi:hypothetical protein
MDLLTPLFVIYITKHHHHHRCPRCSTAIEKDEGCNHMSCRKCRYEFCWICMQDWTLHSNNTGGYFQCNRFEAATADSAKDEGEGDDAEVLGAFPFEHGYAHIFLEVFVCICVTCL